MYFIIFCFTVLMVSSVQSKSIDWFNTLQSDSHSWFGDVKPNNRQQIPNGCGGKPADVYFVFDTSDDVTTEQLQKQKNYASDLVNLFYLNEDIVRIGAVTFGEKPRLVFRSGVFDKHHQIRDALDVTPQIGGKKNTATALEFMNSKVFTRFGSRRSAGHVIIMFTNGGSVSSKATSLKAKALKAKGVYIYTVSVGQKADIYRTELNNMASSPSEKYVFIQNDLEFTESLIELLHIKECDYQISPPYEGPTKICEASRPVDVVFGLDNLSLGTSHSTEIISFIYDLLTQFDNNGHIKSGLILSKSSRLNIGAKITETEELQKKIENIRFPNMADLLKRVRRSFSRGRKHVQKTAILFLDSSVDISKSAQIEAKRNKFLKIETYVIYIGDKNDNMENLKLVANGYGGDNIIVIPSYEELLQYKLDILQTVCRGF